MSRRTLQSSWSFSQDPEAGKPQVAHVKLSGKGPGGKSQLNLFGSEPGRKDEEVAHVKLSGNAPGGKCHLNIFSESQVLVEDDALSSIKLKSSINVQNDAAGAGGGSSAAYKKTDGSGRKHFESHWEQSKSDEEEQLTSATHQPTLRSVLTPGCLAPQEENLEGPTRSIPRHLRGSEESIFSPEATEEMEQLLKGAHISTSATDQGTFKKMSFVPPSPTNSRISNTPTRSSFTPDQRKELERSQQEFADCTKQFQNRNLCSHVFEDTPEKMKRPGHTGRSKLNFTENENQPDRTSVKVHHVPGGKSSIVIGGDQNMPAERTSIHVHAPPGGRSSGPLW